MSQKKMKKIRSNVLPENTQMTEADMVKKVVAFSNTINKLWNSISYYEDYLATTDISEAQYLEILETDIYKELAEKPSREEVNKLVQEQKEKRMSYHLNQINKYKRQYSKLKKQYIAGIDEIEITYPNVYATLQEITSTVMEQNDNLSSNESN